MRRRASVTLSGRTLALGVAIGIAACGAARAQQDEPDDPLEGVNRGVQDFNEALAEHVVAPMAGAVDSAAPEDSRGTGGDVMRHVGNVLDNLGEPKNAMNGALQGNIGTVGTAIARFGINSTVGLLGTFDVARDIGIEERKEDFGQTLGSWGAPSGPYMVAPIAGPTNTRDVTGMVVDSVMNPVGLLSLPGGGAIGAARTGRQAVNAAGDARATADAAAGETDAYDLQRQMYEDRRDAQIANADITASRQMMAPIEHREDRPGTGADGANGAAAVGGGPPVIDVYPLRQDSASGAPVRIAPAQPTVIEIHPAAPATAAPASGEPTRLTPRP